MEDKAEDAPIGECENGVLFVPTYKQIVTSQYLQFSSEQCPRLLLQRMKDVRLSPIELEEATGVARLEAVLEKHQTALLFLLGFAGFSVLVAYGYINLRKYIFRDYHNLDTVFNAGGRVSTTLTAVTIVSHLMWPADFLQSPTLASKVGVSGSVAYTLSVVLSIMVFPVLCIQLKTRAPGAKTLPQIVYARFGTVAHIVFCVIALFTNLVITANLILSGKTAIEVLTKNSSSEFILHMMAVLFGSYCLIGGLGTTFYISYFNTALIFITTSVFIIRTTYITSPEVEEIGSKEVLYKAMGCIKGPDGNFQNSLLTFQTRGGAIYGIVVFFMTVSIIFCDQANWQSRIAAKPREGMLGFFIGAFLWFTVPTSFSFFSSMAYMSMSYKNGTHLLTSAEIDAGYITAFVMENLLGRTGAYLLLTILTMTLMSTGSGEVMSISSIIVYDFYKTHINPFRRNLGPTDCPLCGHNKVSDNTNGEHSFCRCESSIGCKECLKDIEMQLKGKPSYGFLYACSAHGKYRHYEDMLLDYKTWCMVWVIIMIIPYGLLLIESGMNLNWAFMAFPVFIVPFLVSLYLTIAWVKATAKGVVSGLQHFGRNGERLRKQYRITLIVSLCTHNVKSQDDVDREWQKTISIDNPLNPFKPLYEEELAKADAGRVVTVKFMTTIFAKYKFVSYTGAAVSMVLFLIVVPVVAWTQNLLSFEEFNTWLSLCQIWCLIGTVLVIVVPPIEEGVHIWRQHRSNKQEDSKKLQDYSGHHHSKEEIISHL